MFDDSVFVTLQIAALDEVQQVAVGHRFAVFAQLPLDRLEKVAGLLLDEVQRRVDDVLKLGDDVVARDFVEFGVVTGFTAYFAMLSPEFRQLVVDRVLEN